MFTKVYAIIKHFIATYITGGYVEEISTLPPSVQEVATAIPAFIGYTEKGAKNAPTRITSMMEYEQVFGKAKMAAYSVTIDHDNIQFTLPSAAKEYIMYPSLKMFFENGGGACYIVSAGNYINEPGEPDEPIEPDAIRVGISKVSKVDEPSKL